jgi:hypothetical protein
MVYKLFYLIFLIILLIIFLSYVWDKLVADIYLKVNCEQLSPINHYSEKMITTYLYFDKNTLLEDRCHHLNDEGDFWDHEGNLWYHPMVEEGEYYGKYILDLYKIRTYDWNKKAINYAYEDKLIYLEDIKKILNPKLLLNKKKKFYYTAFFYEENSSIIILSKKDYKMFNFDFIELNNFNLLSYSKPNYFQQYFIKDMWISNKYNLTFIPCRGIYSCLKNIT